MAGCTPSYLNKEGEVDGMTPGQQMKAARGGIWPNGFASYLDLLEGWRTQGGLEGLAVSSVG